MGFPHRSVGKDSACNAEDPGSISLSGKPLEEGMATHSSVLAWEIPWTEEPGGLQPIWSHKSWTRLSTWHIPFMTVMFSGLTP